MTSLFTGQQAAYLAIAIAVVGFALACIAWVGRTIRGELGASGTRPSDAGRPAAAEQVPPAVMKEAIARGMVLPAQLAAMTPAERAFLFASLKQKLAAPEMAAPVAARAADATPVIPMMSTMSTMPTMPTTVNAEKLRVWCPMCGTELQLPAHPPLVAGCATCGMRSAVRGEGNGRYTLTISPPAKLS